MIKANGLLSWSERITDVPMVTRLSQPASPVSATKATRPREPHQQKRQKVPWGTSSLLSLGKFIQIKIYPPHYSTLLNSDFSLVKELF